MGGEGSGRTSETTTMGAELMMDDAQFKEFVKLRTVQDYRAVLDMLMGVIKGDEKEFVFDQKGGVMVERKPSLSDKVKAAKVWAEMTLNKIVSDKKTIDNPQQGDLLDLLAGLSEVKSAIEAEKAGKTPALEHEQEAVREGKLVRLKG